MANAGIASGGSLRTIDLATFDRVIEVNLLGTWRTISACLPHVIDRRGYVLVNASMSAITQVPLIGPYAASKAGVEALANTLRMETSHLGIDVGVAYFGWINTELVTGGDEHPAFALVRKTLPGAVSARPTPSRSSVMPSYTGSSGAPVASSRHAGSARSCSCAG